MKYQRCNRCVMDTTAIDIVFDSNGNCNYCSDYINKKNMNNLKLAEDDLIHLLDEIKRKGKGKKYDCIVGVSGGIDSSYVLHLVKEKGLRPLAVHMDNGWNDELAVHNINNLISKLDVDLYTHVIDWVEYREMMKAFLKADVVDIEMLHDHAQRAVGLQQAEKFNIKYILVGNNFATEGIKIPSLWNWFKQDKKNIKNIVKTFSTQKIKTFPLIGIKKSLFLTKIKKINRLAILDYINFSKDDAIKKLVEEYNYKPYPYKHYESIFTRLYQGYILPEKFNIDKRKVHLSSLICNNEISRNEALQLLSSSPYSSEKQLNVDKEFFLKKIKWTLNEFNEYLSRPRIEHSFYGTEKNELEYIKKVYKLVKRK